MGQRKEVGVKGQREEQKRDLEEEVELRLSKTELSHPAPADSPVSCCHRNTVLSWVHSHRGKKKFPSLPAARCGHMTTS